MARDFDRAFAIAREGGLLAAPHGGELTGPASASATAWTTCTPPGSGTGCGRPRTRGCCAGSPTAG